MANTKPKPPCQQLRAWLTANLGKHCLGALTGSDWKAITAAVHILEAYAYDNSRVNLAAFACVVSRMQKSTQHLAYHLIAMILDWGDRESVWIDARGAALTIVGPGTIIDRPTTRCAYEPGGSAWRQHNPISADEREHIERSMDAL